MRLTRKIGLQQTKISERTPVLFKPEFVGKGVCGLLQSVTLFKMRPVKINIAVSKNHNDLYFQRYKDVLDVFLKKRRDSESEWEDIDKSKNVGFRVYDQGIMTYE